jgi:addiction module HigA family antidote
MKPRGLSQNALARTLNVPPRRINEIVLHKRGITADSALRLARYFGTTAEMWAGLQADYDLRLARYHKERKSSARWNRWRPDCTRLWRESQRSTAGIVSSNSHLLFDPVPDPSPCRTKSPI